MSGDAVDSFTVLGGAGDARFGEHSARSIRFPPFIQVTQAWNAQLCQTWSVLGMPEKRRPVRATDAKRGRGFLFPCFEWQP